MTDDWQDVADAIFDVGAVPEPIEKPKRAYAEDMPEKPKRENNFNSSGHLEEIEMRKVLPWIVLFCIAILIGVLVASMIPDGVTQCKDMMDWTIDRIPARCLAELSKGR